MCCLWVGTEHGLCRVLVHRRPAIHRTLGAALKLRDTYCGPGLVSAPGTREAGVRPQDTAPKAGRPRLSVA